MSGPNASLSRWAMPAVGSSRHSTRAREELGASMLVIEHDLPVIMAISDRLYCLETGRIISEGLPEEVRHSPVVISSYLGTDEAAIQRSGREG